MLASARRLLWNVQSFTRNGPMTRKKFLIPDFDACSVALFASLVFMGPLPGRAQEQLPARPALSGPASRDPLTAPPLPFIDRPPVPSSKRR